MSKKELLKELMKEYSFEKAYSYIQIAEEYGFYENEKIIVKMNKKQDFGCWWK